MADKKPVDWQNLGERALWTGAQATASVAIVELGGVQLWWAAPLALALSAAKTWLADKLRKQAIDG